MQRKWTISHLYNIVARVRKFIPNESRSLLLFTSALEYPSWTTYSNDTISNTTFCWDFRYRWLHSFGRTCLTTVTIWLEKSISEMNKCPTCLFYIENWSISASSAIESSKFCRIWHPMMQVILCQLRCTDGSKLTFSKKYLQAAKIRHVHSSIFLEVW